MASDPQRHQVNNRGTGRKRGPEAELVDTKGRNLDSSDEQYGVSGLK